MRDIDPACSKLLLQPVSENGNLFSEKNMSQKPERQSIQSENDLRSSQNREDVMKEDDVRKRAFAMPLTSPAYPPGPYRFLNREFLIITYRTDPAIAARARARAAARSTRRSSNTSSSACRFDRLRRLHRDRPSHSGLIPRPQRRLLALHVPQRRAADRRRTRAVGLSQEARAARRLRAEIDHTGRHPGLRPGAGRHRHDGL